MTENSRIKITFIPILIFLYVFTVKFQEVGHPLLGRWTGEDGQGNKQTFVFKKNNSALWILGSGRHTGTFDIEYDIDYEPTPHQIELSGFESGPLKGRVLYGILEFSGSDTFRMDVEPGLPDSEVRPETFTDQTVTYTRIRPVQHIVLVWLKEPEDKQARQQLIETSKSFKKIPGVVDVSTGTPLESERPVVDDSFDVAVIITFNSREAMHNYETHPVHTRAVEEVLRPLTDRMVVYDFEDR